MKFLLMALLLMAACNSPGRPSRQLRYRQGALVIDAREQKVAGIDRSYGHPKLPRYPRGSE